jgi:hypothetical protein
MRNFSRINNYYNLIEARKDWANLADQYIRRGHGDLVKQFTPPEGAGVKQIDRRINALRQAVNERERPEFPFGEFDNGKHWRGEQ